MPPTFAYARRPRGGVPAGLRLALALAIPFIGAITVIGIYLNKEFIVAAAWVAFSVAAMVLVYPLVGLIAMTAGYLLAAYPTVLQSLGVLTINNLLGLGLAAVTASYIVTTRDLSFLTIRQVLILAVIGILLVLSTAHADVIFPLLQQSQSLGVKGKFLDRTSDMMHDFWTRIIYLIFFCIFVRDRRDIAAMLMTFMLVLFLAVPSALVNWEQGNLSHGFRAAASVTAGANANRLAMIALMEVACWWLWLKARPSLFRWGVALGAIAGSVLVVLASGSRSGLLGGAVLAVVIQTGPRRFRIPFVQIGAAAIAGAIAIMTIVPPEAWQRMVTFSADREDIGGTSVIKREDTLVVGSKMIQDYPIWGVGLGNFREVARQVYLDPYFRPPHNSYMWAASEGGLLVFVAYVVLFVVTWFDLRRIDRLLPRDPASAYLAVALRINFILYSFFAAFADLWLNPITYVLVGLIIAMRQYLERLPPAAAAPATMLARAA